MKIVFISNFFNHHQLPLSIEMNSRQDVEYYFIATERIPKERMEMGYEDMNSKYSFVIEAYKNSEEEKKAKKLVDESDVAIIGSAPNWYIEDRLKNGKLTFIYSERIFKKGFFRVSTLKIISALFIRSIKNRNKKLYMLCASAYAPFDYFITNTCRNKYYKWGYFPETIQYNIDDLVAKKEQNNETIILWVARFIDWKHPELAIDLAKYLKQKAYKFKIQMIGNGYLFENIKKMIRDNQLEDCIELIGAMNPTKVRKYMERANIFIATSDRNEGWGAVVNEAMNSGCCVVANKKIGAVPYLIKNGYNGIIYKNKKQFYYGVEQFINNKSSRQTFSTNAYNTIVDIWNSKKAANNFIILASSLLNNSNIKIEDGPCSKVDKLLI